MKRLLITLSLFALFGAVSTCWAQEENPSDSHVQSDPQMATVQTPDNSAGSGQTPQFTPEEERQQEIANALEEAGYGNPEEPSWLTNLANAVDLGTTMYQQSRQNALRNQAPAARPSVHTCSAPPCTTR
jgi:hypothetical protein